jgi:hypothetical protein
MREKKAGVSSYMSDAKGLIPLGLLGGLGAGAFYMGDKSMEDYDWQAPFKSPLKTKAFSSAKLKELSKDPATYLTLLALLGGGYGVYKLGKGREKKDLLPSPEVAELMSSLY